MTRIVLTLLLFARVANAQWWKHAVVYEIYPRSFQDSNGDGIGDIKGIISRLDYLHDLGVDAIWLTPIYPSPQVDFGYDISNYENIDPQYGTLADFDALVREARARGIRILMDMVMNHTSDQHPWFIESRSSRTNPKRNWYVWRDGKGPGQPPNNWLSEFGHTAWQYDSATGQYYYHKFYPQQPDLNWRNPAVERAMFNAVRFWLNRGVAGFRLDAITTLFEDPELRDERVLPGINAYGDPNEDDARTDNHPEVHDVLRALRKVIDTYSGERVLIGETYLHGPEDLNKMYGKNNDELQLPMDMQVGLLDTLDAAAFRRRITEAQTMIRGNTPLFVFNNHDLHRSWDRYHPNAARIVATILLATRGTAQMYYGEELGMKTTPPTRKEDVRDPIGVIGWPKEKGRDGERTPMQWDATANAGFSTTTGIPWLPVPPTSDTVNVAREKADPGSLLSWYRRLIALRRTNSALRDGTNQMLDYDQDNVLAWLRKSSGGTVLVACNLSPEAKTITLRGALRPILRSDSAATGRSLPPYAVYIGAVE
jgi:alpha-glucosidase